MTKTLIKLGTLVLNVLIRSKLHGDAKDNFTDIMSTLESYGLDELEARSVNRGFEKIIDDIANSCIKVLNTIDIDEDKKKAIINNIIKAYENMSLPISEFLQIHADEDKIIKKLLSANPSYNDNLDLKEQELYKRLLEHTSHLLVNAYMKIPEFSAEGIKRLNIKIDEIADKMDELITQMDKVNQLVSDKGSEISTFERQYRNKIISQNNYVYLFGAGDLASEYKRYQLSIAYVELEIEDELSGKEIKIDKLFKKSKNIWLSGDAGLGKTTLLQWIAVKSAENDKEISSIRDTIPILIKLRQYDCNKISLHDCIKHVMKDSSYDIPSGWIEQSINMGRLVFLIDGFDEVSEEERNIIFNWLEEIDPKGKCIKIYTARPQVKERPYNINLLEANILPMNRARIRKFIDYWHKAVLEEQLKVDKSDAEIIVNGLYEKIIFSDPLMKLATVPLLCAMICALHYKSQMNLPSNKRELYEECCKMLIDRRDKERKISQTEINLNYEQKKIILSKLAYWMIKNNYVEVSKEDAEKNVKRSTDGMDLQDTIRNPRKIFTFLLERCGVLRELEKGKVDFIHRTFQEYLAAYEISREDDWGVIEDKIGNTTWQETIGLSIGFAKKDIATRIIRTTLDMGVKKCEQKKYFFLAISYLSGAVEVDRNLREQIGKEVENLIPPSIKECAQIAEAGDLAIQFLIDNPMYNNRERLACLRVLRMIGTIKSLEISKTYFEHMLSDGEINEIAGLYGQFPISELLENDIPNIIAFYIEKICNSNISLHSKMISILRFLNEDRLQQIYNKKINSLKINHYCNEKINLQKNIFANIKTLTLKGDFTTPAIITNFANIQKLKIHSISNDFSIYTLNLYSNLYKIKQFSAILESDEYITGIDLPFLSKCEELELIFLHNSSEISFENFYLLKALKKLTIGAEFALELNYDLLPDTIESITILVPATDVLYAEKNLVPFLEFDQIMIKPLEIYFDDI